MLNLGIVNAAPSQPEVSLEEVQTSLLKYVEAEQQLTNYMNFMEIVRGLKKHSSSECLEFATELLGVSTDTIRKASNEDYEARVSQESFNVWKMFSDAWNAFYGWIKRQFQKIIDFFKKKPAEGAKEAPKQLTAAPDLPPTSKVPPAVAKNEVAKAAATTTTLKVQEKAAQKPVDKFSSTPKTNFVVGTPNTWKVTQSFSNGMINSLRSAIKSGTEVFKDFEGHRVNQGKFNPTIDSIVREISHFRQSKNRNSKVLDSNESKTYVKLLETLTDEMNALVKTADKAVNAPYNGMYINGIHKIRTAGRNFISFMTAEVNHWRTKQKEQSGSNSHAV